MMRPVEVVLPDGGESETGYDNTPTHVNPASATPACSHVAQHFVESRQKQQADGSAWIDSVATFDGLGRTITTQLTDPEGNDFVDTTYDADGRVHSVSNPHRSASGDPTAGTTTYSYDALGRVTQVLLPDNNVIS